MGHAEQLRKDIQEQGETAIERFFAERQGETLHLEFKRTAQQEPPPDRRIQREKEDRAHLAKAISGFGNSNGGVIVWGVEARDEEDGDYARDSQRIREPKAFEAFLRRATPAATYPPHPYVEHFCIPTAGLTPGFVVTFIPKLIGGPLRVAPSHEGSDRYYIRSVSSFVAAPHEVLAGLFGIAPPPEIAIGFRHDTCYFDGERAHLMLAGFLRNTGRVVAEATFLTVLTQRSGLKCKMHLEISRSFPTYHDGVQEDATLTAVQAGVADKAVRIAPGQVVKALTLDCVLVPPFERDLVLEVTFGCTGMYPRTVRTGRTPADLRDDFKAALETAKIAVPNEVDLELRARTDRMLSNLNRDGGVVGV